MKKLFKLLFTVLGIYGIYRWLHKDTNEHPIQ